MIASAAYTKASGDKQAADHARKIFGTCIAYASGEKNYNLNFLIQDRQKESAFR
jgi:N-acylglucosamine 2-epimerase